MNPETVKYIEELPAIFNELARGFANQAYRPEGTLESHAGQTAADFLGLFKTMTADGRLTPGQAWTALAADRGNVGACNTLGNMARAMVSQLCQSEAGK